MPTFRDKLNCFKIIYPCNSFKQTAVGCRGVITAFLEAEFIAMLKKQAVIIPFQAPTSEGKTERFTILFALPSFFLLTVTHSKDTWKPLPFRSNSSFSIRRSSTATECSSESGNEILWIIINGFPSSSLNIIYRGKKSPYFKHTVYKSEIWSSLLAKNQQT